jgi:HPr kinase/phosphorylase
MVTSRRMHGSCVARNGNAVLVLGPPGSGKSDLVLRLLARGFDLVADDQVDIADGMVSCPAELAGLLEARGIGIVQLPYCKQANLVLIIDLGRVAERLPAPLNHPELHRPVIHVDAAAASAPDRVALALDCALGLVGQVAGTFAA